LSYPWQIPQSWTWVQSREVAEIVGGGTPRTDDRTNFDDGDVPWITPADLSGYKNKLISRGARNITKKGLENSGARVMPKGTVLFSSRAPIGYVAIASNPVSTNQGFKSFVLHPFIKPDYAYYYLQRAKDLAVELSSGTTFREISGAKAKLIPFPVAPIAEQERIVGEIEKQFTRLDAAVAALNRVHTNLKRYRAAVLKAACEGRLVPTEAELARQEGRSYEPASVLLQRVLAKRRSRWEEARTGGKNTEYKPPSDLLSLPNQAGGWSWASLGSIAELKGGLTKGQKRKPGEIVRDVPYLRVANVQRGYLDLDEVKTIKATEQQIRELRLEKGDVLFNEGGDRDKLGRGWVWDGTITECVHQNHVFRARLIGDVMPPKFLSWYGNSIGQRYFADEGKQTTNLASINMTKLSMLPVPIPPVAEQKRIVAELERRLSIFDEVDAGVTADLTRAERLRQAILRTAFMGKLVSQDPKDEPADALLELIRSQRNKESQSKAKTIRKKGTLCEQRSLLSLD
jgi:type I restriction enzyme, S subunit